MGNTASESNKYNTFDIDTKSTKPTNSVRPTTPCSEFRVLDTKSNPKVNLENSTKPPIVQLAPAIILTEEELLQTQYDGDDYAKQQQEWIEKIKINGAELENIPSCLITSEICEIALKQDTKYLMFVPPDLLDNDIIQNIINIILHIILITE